MTPLARLATRIAYGATQLPRLAWYAGHGYALQRLAAEARRREGESDAPPRQDARRMGDNRAPVLRDSRLYGDMADLLARDLSRKASTPCPSIMTARSLPASAARGCSSTTCRRCTAAGKSAATTRC
jgi:hypothetical protein